MTTTDAKGIVGEFAEHADDWGTPMNANLRHLSAMSASLLAYNPTASSGLTYAYRAGLRFVFDHYEMVGAGTVALTAGQLNYVQLNAAGEVVTSTVGWLAGALPMATVNAGGSSFADGDVTDVRPFLTVQPNPFVFDVEQFGADGGADDGPAFRDAIAAASDAGGGVVLARYRPDGYNLGTANPALAIPSNVTLECPNGALFLNYTGTGLGIDLRGASYAALRNIYLLLSDDAADGICFGGSASLPSFWCRMDNVTVQGNGSATNAGRNFVLDSGPQFCAYLSGRQVYGLGCKFGIDIIGQSAGSHTWTTIQLDQLVLVGRSAGIVSGSVGVRVDANSNLAGSSLPGVVIESFESSHQIASGGYGLSMPNAEIEGNTTDLPTPPNTFNGEINDYHHDYQYRQTTNGASNLWMRELIRTGLWHSESRYDRIHAIYQGGSTMQRWGLRRGNLIAGEATQDKFIVACDGVGGTSPNVNFMKLLEYKIAWNNAAPAGGSWGKGSVIFNTAPSTTTPILWLCRTSGTFKSSPGVTAITTSGQPTVTVSGISTLEVGDYITIAGAFTTPTRIHFIAGNVLTMETNASGSVSGVAVVYPSPVFAAAVDTNFATPVAIGAHPATIGALRLENGSAADIVGRNADDDGDISIILVDANDKIGIDTSGFGSYTGGHFKVAGKIFPGGPDLSAIGSLSAFLVQGSGSPEGVIIASVGSLYLRTDGGANTSLYVKESGAGNTGWVAK